MRTFPNSILSLAVGLMVFSAHIRIAEAAESQSRLCRKSDSAELCVARREGRLDGQASVAAKAKRKPPQNSTKASGVAKNPARTGREGVSPEAEAVVRAFLASGPKAPSKPQQERSFDDIYVGGITSRMELFCKGILEPDKKDLERGLNRGTDTFMRLSIYPGDASYAYLPDVMLRPTFGFSGSRIVRFDSLYASDTIISGKITPEFQPIEIEIDRLTGTIQTNEEVHGGKYQSNRFSGTCERIPPNSKKF